MARTPLKIAIVGPQCAGKTTVAQALARYALHPVTVKFAQPHYDVLALLHQPKHRLFMQEFSDVAKRHFGQGIFVELMRHQLDQAMATKPDLVLCDDLRYLAEADLVQDTFFLVYVEAAEAVRQSRATAQGLVFNAQHNSEAELEELKHRADFVVVNHGHLDDLHLEAAQVADTLGLTKPRWWHKAKKFFSDFFIFFVSF